MFPNLGNLYGVITKFYLYKKKKFKTKKLLINDINYKMFENKILLKWSCH